MENNTALSINGCSWYNLAAPTNMHPPNLIPLGPSEVSLTYPSLGFSTLTYPDNIVPTIDGNYLFSITTKSW